jgi:importin-7
MCVITDPRHLQAQKFEQLADEDDDDLDEESLLETPLNRLEPYQMFKNVMIST